MRSPLHDTIQAQRLDGQHHVTQTVHKHYFDAVFAFTLPSLQGAISQAIYTGTILQHDCILPLRVLDPREANHPELSHVHIAPGRYRSIPYHVYCNGHFQHAQPVLLRGVRPIAHPDVSRALNRHAVLRTQVRETDQRQIQLQGDRVRGRGRERVHVFEAPGSRR